MAKTARRTRKRYTEQQRQQILETARKEGLTAAAVQKRFNVTPVTYYSWRKKAGATRRRGRPPGTRTATANGNLTGQVRQEVQQRVRAIIPEIVRSEVSAYLDGVLAGGGGRRRRRRRRAKS
jgi:transposase-like protein